MSKVCALTGCPTNFCIAARRIFGTSLVLLSTKCYDSYHPLGGASIRDTARTTTMGCRLGAFVAASLIAAIAYKTMYSGKAALPPLPAALPLVEAA